MSYTLPIYALDGSPKETMELASVFADSEINQELIHEYVVMYLANQRQGTAKTKTRAEVSLSGKKLFRQKGTGRARVGDAGSPIRRKGGVAFGPSPAVRWAKKMNQKMKQKALLWSLVLQLKAGVVAWVTAFSFQAPKTAQAATILHALSLKDCKTLVVLEAHDDQIYKSFRNMSRVSVTTVGLLNPYDVLTHQQILFTKQAAHHLSERFHLLAH